MAVPPSAPVSHPSPASSWPPASAADFPRIGSLPAYVFAQVNAEKAERIAAGEDVIDLGMGNPDLGTPGHIVEELVAQARDKRHHRYSSSRGIYGLRGGNYNDAPQLCRAAFRYYRDPEESDRVVGFRVAVSLDRG